MQKEIAVLDLIEPKVRSGVCRCLRPGSGFKFGPLLRLLRFALFVAMLLGSIQGWSQTSRPKIGLVLSGGGAKGLAHIRILQVLDSLGIVPDYIAGTSMGSVVGGLYAAGYSAHSVDSIARSIDWSYMFSNNLSFDQINIEEKDEFGRYIYELPLEGLKPKLPLGLVEGQHIEELFTELFFPVHNVTDFRKLPTPFICIASDILKGEAVVLKRGSLAKAVRASMSIPTVFNPVRIDGKLLVDGGLYSNLPVSYCRAMGADYIIGVDVGGGLMTESELTTAAHFMLQATFLAGNVNYEMEKSQSDIFIDVFKHLKFGTGDFEEGPSMMHSGDLAVHNAMPQLVELAQRISKYPLRKILRPVRRSSSYKLDRIQIEGVSKDNEKLVMNRFAWHVGEKANGPELMNSVNRLMGTRLFSKIGYSIEGDSVQSSVMLRGEERPANAAKFAMHFDSDRGAGIILNFTKRNFLLPASRTVATIDLAENPRIKLNYFYYVGKASRWWHFTEFYNERVLMNSFVEGTPVQNVINNHTSISTLMNYTITKRSFLGIGPVWKWDHLSPKIDPRDQSHPDTTQLIEFNSRTVGVRFQYQHNSADKVFYPTRGRWTKFESTINVNTPFDASLYETLNGTSTQIDVNSQIRSYLQFNFKSQRNIPLSSHTTLQVIGQAFSTFEVSHEVDYHSPYKVGVGTFATVGSQLTRPRSNNFAFVGLLESELVVPQLLTAGAHLQMALAKNIYVTPSVNVLAAGYDASNYWSTLTDFRFSDCR